MQSACRWERTVYKGWRMQKVKGAQLVGGTARQSRKGEARSTQVQGGGRQWRRMRRSRLAQARRHGQQPKVSQTAACAHASNGDTLIHGTARRRSGPPALCLKLNDDTERVQNEAQHSSTRYHPCVCRALSLVDVAPLLRPILLCSVPSHSTASEASRPALHSTYHA
jgi:hypothetical protein